ncbi:hypothetical protein L1987_22351 [Smallanthus sonchifolius]|uniref:Uncharacterized protein n=1 Tax=Smallanthus sonchifolius TaxID=185202 RepID=A0ACB9IG29_9ASTR|nr:hypothetical protein L1987_22351 [Smallanthus sonchifolius]
MAFILFLILAFLLHGAQGEIICEELPTSLCTFSIASSGQRCLLENNVKDNGEMEYQCNTSDIIVKDMKEWIESDECMNACGVHRKTVGISSDSLLEPRFIARICSGSCYNNCPNIVDLYHNLAIGEGVFLANLCEVHSKMPRRAMIQFSSSAAADGPISMAEAPTSI